MKYISVDTVFQNFPKSLISCKLLSREIILFLSILQFFLKFRLCMQSFMIICQGVPEKRTDSFSNFFGWKLDDFPCALRASC